MLSLGVVGTSRKPDERRLAIHPDHVDRVEGDVVFETGYGEPFGKSDAQLGRPTAARAEVMGADVVLLPKPLPADLEDLREGAVLWGWPHCVQDAAMTQAAIDRGLTVIAWEAMNHWRRGRFDVHVFHKNNELAGYCSVLHALSLTGRTGDYGPRMRAAVISFGATGRGAVRGLAALGISDITVFTQRDVAHVASPFASVKMEQFDRDDRMGEMLSGFDVVVNCILQDPTDPIIFVRDADLDRYRPGALFVDVSCDEGMGFEWAKPTSFAEPTFGVGDGCTYYAVDHSPSYLWASATWEISEALLGYVPTVLAGPDAWDADETVRRAIEIREGRVCNPAILEFQGRGPDPPYPIRR